jgi:hypothetical protein
LLVLVSLLLGVAAQGARAAPMFEVAFSQDLQRAPLSGRVFILISRTADPEPRLQLSVVGPQHFAVDARAVKPGETVIIDDGVIGHPYDHLQDLPKGDYVVQAFAVNYVEYPRADGHTIWALDQWNGQDFTRSPGVLYSSPQKMALDPAQNTVIKIQMTERTPEAKAPVDTKWLKHIKIRSEILTKFWGRPIYLGASVLLPKGYDESPTARYPIIYEQKSHYLRTEAFDVSETPVVESDQDRAARLSNGYESGYEFFKAWTSKSFPRVIIARLIHPTPYYDYSGMLNAANDGPYQDAVMKELIPYIESHFRTIERPDARILVGKSTGGRDALTLQVAYPDVFGGAWMLYPAAFDFRRFFGSNVYEDDNFFYVSPRDQILGRDADSPWTRLERPYPLSLEGQPAYTLRAWAHHEFAVGGLSSVNEELNGTYNATLSPVGPDGYPVPLYDMQTGAIDRSVAEYWRAHGDMGDYIRSHWSQIGSRLVGKLHFSIGDADEWYRQYAVYDLEAFFREAKPAAEATFVYGRRKGHLWQPETNAALINEIADYMVAHAPPGADNRWRRGD